MSNILKYKNTVVAHPGYYIEEYIDYSGLTQQDFAYRLGTTPKNLSKLINGEQNLSVDMAIKLSKMLGTSTDVWLNLQNSYDKALAEIKYSEILNEEISVLNEMGYAFFKNNFKLPALLSKKEEQVSQTRHLLGVSSLLALKKPDLTASFKSDLSSLDEKSVIKANALLLLALKEACEVDAPSFSKKKFKKAVDFALSQTANKEGFFPEIKNAFLDAGVILVMLPDLKGSNINGAVKKFKSNVVLMLNDRRLYADVFWFTLLHEAFHILNGDYGVTFDLEAKNSQEDAADKFAEDKLIPSDLYDAYVSDRKFDLSDIEVFAAKINRDPGIVVGKLQKDGYVSKRDKKLLPLKDKLKVMRLDY